MLKLYVKTANALANFFKREEGVTAVEYALIAAAIVIAIIAGVKLVGTNTNAAFGSIATAV